MVKLGSFLFAFFLAGPFSIPLAQAQTTAGTHTFGGSVNTGRFLARFEDMTTLNFNANYGFFPLNQFAVGADVQLQYFSGRQGVSVSVLLGPFLRYYLPYESPVRVFFSGGFGGGITDDDQEELELYSWKFGAGIDFFILPKVAVELGFTQQWTGYNSDNISYLTTGPNFTAGVQLFLKRQIPKDEANH